MLIWNWSIQKKIFALNQMYILSYSYIVKGSVGSASQGFYCGNMLLLEECGAFPIFKHLIVDRCVVKQNNCVCYM